GWVGARRDRGDGSPPRPGGRAVRARAPALARPGGGGEEGPPLGRTDAVDGPVGGRVPRLRRRGARRSLPRRRRPRVRRLLPRRHRRDDRSLAGADRSRGRRAGESRNHAHAPQRGRALGRERARAPIRPPRRPFPLPATDANRFAIGLARELTGRPKILVFNWCYHGSVDETFATLDGEAVVARAGNVGPPVALGETTRVVEWNDVGALERELAHGDVACVLTEPALTNVGIVLPEPGFHAALRELTCAGGTPLIIDETHTICAGPGGYTAARGLEPALLTIGKPIAGGIPAAAYGFSADVAARLESILATDELADVGGIGGTVAANVLSLAAMRATLGDVLTDEAFARMISLG